MDINSLVDKSVLENVDGLQGLQSSANRDHCPPSSLADDLINDLANAVAEAFSLGAGEESLNIEDVGRESVDIKEVAEVEQTSNGDRISSVEHRDANKGPQEVKVTRKSLNKCATFPNPNGVPTPDTSSNLEEEPQTALCSQSGEEHCHQAYARSLSLPAPSKLLSALKGSREKVGLSPGKLSVTWAPDVYDPPATSMSHTLTSKKQQKSKNKKYWKRDGKKGQKSSSSRGKEKKQYRRSGASERSHRSLDIRETSLVDTNNDFGELMVGSPDQHSYCGSSFMKNSLSQMHYPVAEAL